MDRDLLCQQLSQLPLLQYEFFSPQELLFSDAVRHICREECSMYGTNWACPPAVGTVEQCKARCLAFEQALLITTITEIPNAFDMDAALATRPAHEAITHQVEGLLKAQGCSTMALSTEACSLCRHCTYPDAPCRHPDKMYPCVESHGIVVTDLAERHGIEFLAGSNLVTWFSIIFFTP